MEARVRRSLFQAGSVYKRDLPSNQNRVKPVLHGSIGPYRNFESAWTVLSAIPCLLLWTGSALLLRCARQTGQSSKEETPPMNPVLRHAPFLLLLSSAALIAQQSAPQPTTAAEAPIATPATLTPSRAPPHVTRVVPVPKTIEVPRAQLGLEAGRIPDQGPPQSLADRRKTTDEYTARARCRPGRLPSVPILS